MSILIILKTESFQVWVLCSHSSTEGKETGIIGNIENRKYLQCYWLDQGFKRQCHLVWMVTWNYACSPLNKPNPTLKTKGECPHFHTKGGGFWLRF